MSEGDIPVLCNVYIFPSIHPVSLLIFIIGKEKSNISKRFSSHVIFQDDDTNSDSGLEPESPIARRRLFNISSVKHTGMCNVLYIQELCSSVACVYIISCSQIAVFHVYSWSGNLTIDILCCRIHKF